MINLHHNLGYYAWSGIRASIWHGIGSSIYGKVWDNTYVDLKDYDDSVADSWKGNYVWRSACANVWAYAGSLFPGIKRWKYIKHKEGEYPFQPIVDLWHRGFVVSFDGNTWRLHSGKNAKIVYKERI